MIAELRRALEAVAVPSDAGPMSAYMKGHFPFLGVKTPARRAAATATIAELRGAPVADLLAFADACFAQPEREFQYVACDALRWHVAVLDGKHLADGQRFITTKSWWDTVDTLAAHVVGAMALDRRELWDTIDGWVDHDDFWLARSAILQQLTYKDATDAGVLFDRCLRRASDKEFFIRKAIGWALRAYASVDAAEVRSFVEAHRDVLSPLSVREATKHI